MKRWIHASKDYKEVRCSNVTASTSFDVWYDSLSSPDQEKVDDLADDMGLPLYAECSEAELAQLHDSFVSNKGNSNITASSKLSVDNFADYYSPDYYPEYDSKRLKDAQGIDWYISIEDPEFIIDDIKDFPDLSVIKQVEYFDDDQQDWAEDNGWDGGYNVRYNDGSIKQFAWHAGSSKMYELGPDEYGNWKYRRSANDSKYAQMQTELEEDRINRAGSYSRYIANR